MTNNKQNISFSPEEYHIDFTGDFWRLLQVEVILEDDYENLPTEDYLDKKIREIIEEEFKKEKCELVFTRTNKRIFLSD